jgi:hypothetical protein
VAPKSDYRFRAFVSRARVTRAIMSPILGINYTNFKDSAHDVDRHFAYRRIWQAMAKCQDSTRT